MLIVTGMPKTGAATIGTQSTAGSHVVSAEVNLSTEIKLVVALRLSSYLLTN